MVGVFLPAQMASYWRELRVVGKEYYGGGGGEVPSIYLCTCGEGAWLWEHPTTCLDIALYSFFNRKGLD